MNGWGGYIITLHTHTHTYRSTRSTHSHTHIYIDGERKHGKGGSGWLAGWFAWTEGKGKGLAGLVWFRFHFVSVGWVVCWLSCVVVVVVCIAVVAVVE